MLRRWRWVAAGVALALAVWMAAPYVTSAAFVLDMAGRTGGVRRLLPAPTQPVTTRDVAVVTRHGSIAARIYEAAAPTRSLVVFPGIHAGGLDEPRLVTFSRRLAATGARVLSVPLPDLRAFRITPRTTDMIEDAALWMATQPDLAPSGRVSLAGVSFAGGLALVAAGRPALADRVDRVVSIGGHASLPRVMAYYCSGRLPDGGTRPPNEYGGAVLLLAAADRIVPPAQADPMRQAVTMYLQASSAASADADGARAATAEALRLADELAEPARTYVTWARDRQTQELGAVIAPWIETLGGDPALSPDRSPVSRAPIFLLHGAGDNLIPSEETPLAAADADARGAVRARWLITPLLSHTDVSQAARARDVWDLVAFWKDVLGR